MLGLFEEVRLGLTCPKEFAEHSVPEDECLASEKNNVEKVCEVLEVNESIRRNEPEVDGENLVNLIECEEFSDQQRKSSRAHECQNEYCLVNISQSSAGEKLSDSELLKSIEAAVSRCWSVEELDHDEELAPSQEEDLAEKMLREKIIIKPDGRIQVPCLWKPGEPDFPSNYDQVKKRLFGMLNSKLMRDTNFWNQYDGVFLDWEQKNFIHQVKDDNPRRKGTYYWCHFPVVKPHKATTKIRPVFDGAAKFDGFCANDKMFQGPMYLNDLADVVLRWRRYQVAATGDVEQMFLHIELPEEDRPYNRFLWFRQGKLIIYEYSRHMFGKNNSSCAAIVSTVVMANKFRKLWPLAYEAIIRGTIVDDITESSHDWQIVLSTCKQLKALFSKCCMTIRKFVANSAELMRELSPEDRIQEMSSDEEMNRIFAGEQECPEIKVLGVVWNVVSDRIAVAEIQVDETDSWSKLEMLGQLHRVYDPLGLAIPVMLKGRIIMQESWKREMKWKDKLTDALQVRWQEWLQEARKIQNVAMQRTLMPGDVKAKDAEVHVFSDASEVAYAAAAYIRTENDGKVQTRLAMARMKVRPVKSTFSIPKMELLGLEMGSKLAQKVARAIDVPVESIFLWTDSKAVYDWLRIETRRLQTFIRNRTVNIKMKVPTERILWTPGLLNPADLATREIGLDALLERRDWFYGPEFLSQQQSEWPRLKDRNVETSLTDTDEAWEGLKKGIKEERVVVHQQLSLATVSTDKDVHTPLLSLWTRLSRLRFIIRAMARAMRWRDSVGGKKVPKNTPVSPEEYQRATRIITSVAQRESFPTTWSQLSTNGTVYMSNNLRDLEPFMDTDQYGTKVIRLGGRIEASKMHRDYKHPMLIHKSHPLAELLMREAHELKLSHVGGWSAIIQETNKSHWILHPVPLARKITSRCVVCKRRAPRPETQIMAPLPYFRLPEAAEFPFQFTAVDAAGPFFTTAGRGKPKYKRYALVMRCATVGAVHIELLGSMDTDNFLLALDRFLAFRPQPKVIICDNGSNFGRAEKELELMHWDAGRIQGKHPTIEFRFGPPRSPHFNGLVEIMVKAAKKALKTTMDTCSPNDLEFHTALYKATSYLNNIPISYTVRSAVDIQWDPLTPNHFLRGQIYSDLAPLVAQGSDYSLKYQKYNQIMGTFWKRLMFELTTYLRSYSKWSAVKRDVAEGDIVVHLEDQNPRGKFPLARVESVVKGTDNHVRRIRIFDGRSYYDRSISNIAILLPANTANARPTQDNSKEVNRPEDPQPVRRSARVAAAAADKTRTKH